MGSGRKLLGELFFMKYEPLEIELSDLEDYMYSDIPY